MVVCRSEICATIAADLLDRRHRRGGVALDRQHPAGDVLGRLRRLLGQLLDLVGDHGEALARLAGPRRLDRRVQRQQVGLLGDARDHLDHVADLGRGLAQLRDRRRRGLGGRAPRGRPPRWPRRRWRRSPGSRHPSAPHRPPPSARCGRPPPPRWTRRRTARRSPPPTAEICADDADSSSDDAATASAEATTGSSTLAQARPRRVQGRGPSGPSSSFPARSRDRSGHRRRGPRRRAGPAARSGGCPARSRRRGPARPGPPPGCRSAARPCAVVVRWPGVGALAAFPCGHSTAGRGRQRSSGDGTLSSRPAAGTSSTAGGLVGERRPARTIAALYCSIPCEHLSGSQLPPRSSGSVDEVAVGRRPQVRVGLVALLQEAWWRTASPDPVVRIGGQPQGDHLDADDLRPRGCRSILAVHGLGGRRRVGQAPEPDDADTTATSTGEGHGTRILVVTPRSRSRAERSRACLRGSVGGAVRGHPDSGAQRNGAPAEPQRDRHRRVTELHRRKVGSRLGGVSTVAAHYRRIRGGDRPFFAHPARPGENTDGVATGGIRSPPRRPACGSVSR